MAQRLLITGSGGRLGRVLRARLARPCRSMRLLDLGAQAPPGPGEPVETVRGDLTDAGVLARACADVDAVLHLGGLTGEDTWERLLRVNVEGTRTVLEAARAAGVPRVLLASSVHAAGFYRLGGPPPAPEVTGAGPARRPPQGVPAPHAADGVPAAVAPRPDAYYGWTKAAAEALGSLYADRFGMTVFALRLGDCTPEPAGEWALASWLSPADCVRLVEACLSTPVTGFRAVWGISRNTRRRCSLVEGEEIGYRPLDDAEAYADRVPPAEGGRAETIDLLGGHHTTVPLGVPR